MTSFQQKVFDALTNDYRAEYYIRREVYPNYQRSSQADGVYRAHIIKTLIALACAGLAERLFYRGYPAWRRSRQR